jgi:hypothetical protein
MPRRASIVLSPRDVQLAGLYPLVFSRSLEALPGDIKISNRQFSGYGKSREGSVK